MCPAPEEDPRYFTFHPESGEPSVQCWQAEAAAEANPSAAVNLNTASDDLITADVFGDDLFEVRPYTCFISYVHESEHRFELDNSETISAAAQAGVSV